MGDTYSDLKIGHYNREAMISIDHIVNAMSVRTVAETIECVDGSDSFCGACGTMYEKRFDVLGVRENGRVVGYVPRSHCDMHLSESTPCSIVMLGTAGEFRESTFDPSLKLYDALQELTRRQRLFIRDTESGDVVGIVTRADLQKAPVRIMIFAYIAVFEIHLTELIRDRYPGEEWKTLVTVRRNQERDRNKRMTVGEETDLLDCLDLSQKFDIVVKTRDILADLDLQELDIDLLFRDIKDLRNALAHGHSLANTSRRWVRVAEIVRRVRGINSAVESRNREPSTALPREACHA